MLQGPILSLHQLKTLILLSPTPPLPIPLLSRKHVHMTNLSLLISLFSTPPPTQPHTHTHARTHSSLLCNSKLKSWQHHPKFSSLCATAKSKLEKITQNSLLYVQLQNKKKTQSFTTQNSLLSVQLQIWKNSRVSPKIPLLSRCNNSRKPTCKKLIIHIVCYGQMSPFGSISLLE